MAVNMREQKQWTLDDLRFDALQRDAGEGLAAHILEVFGDVHGAYWFYHFRLYDEQITPYELVRTNRTKEVNAVIGLFERSIFS